MRRSTLALPLLAGAVLVSGCGSSGSQDEAGTAAGGPVDVEAGDDSCTVGRTDLSAGTTVFALKNVGSKVTEVYLYGPGDKIVAEKENIGPGLSYELTAQLSAGDYEVSCKPGMTGAGIRTKVTVAGAGAGASADPAAVKAVATYRAYVQSEADALVPLVKQFAAAVTAGDVVRAKALYAPSRAPWERIEPVAESFGDIDPLVDAREADLEPGQAWTGWHRIEKALWVDGSTAGLADIAAGLVTEIGELQERVSSADLTVASIGNGAKELLDEVASGKITGEEEAFSHTDLADVEANLTGAEKAFESLVPLVEDAALIAQTRAAFTAAEQALAPYRAGQGFVSYDTVDDAGRRSLAQVVDALGEPLSRLSAAATR